MKNAAQSAPVEQTKDSFLKRFMIVIWMFLLLTVLGIFYMVCDKSALSLAANINITMGLVTLAGLTMLCLVVTMDQTPRGRTGDLFYLMIVLIYFGVVGDNMGWFVIGNPKYKALIHVFNVLSFLVPPLYCTVYCVYQDRLLPPKPYHTRQHYVTYILATLDILVILVGSFTGTLYWLDDAGQFHDGWLTWLLLLFPVYVISVSVHNNLTSKIPMGKRIALLSLTIPSLAGGILSLALPRYSVIYVISFFVLMLIYGTVQMERSIDHARQAKELVEKQTEIMISQIQPHFLYNTLSVISFLCEEDGKLAQEAVENFALYLRTNMDSLQSKEPVPFTKELEHTKTYLWIEKMRFGDILNVKYDIQYSDFTLPPLTLQPIVENAVKHGVRSRDEGGTLTISTRREGKAVLICVSDDGMGFDPKKAYNDGRVHIGIDNARNRLALLCGGKLQIESEIGVGTTVTIRLEGNA